MNICNQHLVTLTYHLRYQELTKSVYVYVKVVESQSWRVLLVVFFCIFLFIVFTLWWHVHFFHVLQYPQILQNI